MQSERQNLVEKPKTQEQPRKPYSTPKLTVYGTVEQITLTVGTKGTDGLTGSSLL
jgi:hypothetical protein